MSDVTADVEASSGSGLIYHLLVPLMLALVVHAIAILALVEGWTVTDESRFAPQVEVLEATLIQLEPEAPAPAAVVEQPQVETPAPTPRREAEPAARDATPAADARVDDALEPAPEPPPPEPPPPAETSTDTRQADFEDDALRDMLDRALENAIANEAALLSESEADAEVASYVGAIVSRIERNWSRPPSARNGMQAELLIGLVPTGELIAVEVGTSSGNAAFDRSALLAVRDAAPFDVPDDPAQFERSFRRLRILFRPEDLRN